MYTETMQKEQATVADFSSTGDKLTLTPAVPIELVEIVIVVTTALVAADAMVVKADVRPVAGSDTNRTDGTAGVMTLTATEATADAGDVIRCRIENPISIVPGQQLMLELTDAITSGAGIIFAVYRNKPVYRDAASVETVVTDEL